MADEYSLHAVLTMFSCKQIGMDLRSLTTVLPVGFGSDFDSQFMKLVFGPSQSEFLSDRYSGIVLCSHVYHATTRKYIEQSAAKHQQT